jgi:hypothetical protein
LSTQGAYKGWKALILIDDTEIGYTESVTLDVATGLEPYYQHGSRYPADLAEGNEELTGSISRAWIDMELMTFAVTNDADGKGSAAGLTAFELYMYLDPADTGAPFMYVYGCKAESGAIDIPQDGFVMGDIDFRALYLWYGLE